MNLMTILKELIEPKEAQPMNLTAILLIDNSKQDSLFIQRTLEKKYYQVFTTNNGDEGLQIASLVKIDLVILDYHLQGLNGIEVCKVFKANAKTKDIPILFFTIVQGGELIIQCYEAGADLYLPKSLPSKLLLQEVE
jgi:DNA-binding response OmpR family regulator